VLLLVADFLTCWWNNLERCTSRV